MCRPQSSHSYQIRQGKFWVKVDEMFQRTSRIFRLWWKLAGTINRVFVLSILLSVSIIEPPCRETDRVKSFRTAAETEGESGSNGVKITKSPSRLLSVWRLRVSSLLRLPAAACINKRWLSLTGYLQARTTTTVGLCADLVAQDSLLFLLGSVVDCRWPPDLQAGQQSQSTSLSPSSASLMNPSMSPHVSTWRLLHHRA